MLMLNELWKQLGRRPLCASLTGALLVGVVPALGEEKPAASQTSVRVSPALQARVRDLIEEVSEAAVELDVTIDRPKLIRGKKDVMRIIVSNPQIVKVEQIDGRDLEVIGKRPGSTNVTLWIGDQKQTQILQLVVVVKSAPGAAPTAFRDEGTENQEAIPIEERGGTDLEHSVQEQFPRSQIRLLSAADRVLVHGTARDSQEAARIMKFLRQRVAENATAAGAQNPAKVAETRVVNLLKIRGESQLRLRVQRVEIPRTSLRDFCQQFNVRFEQQPAGGWDMADSAPSVAALDASAFHGYLKVLQTRRTVKVTEEPSLLAIPGRAVHVQAISAAEHRAGRAGVQQAAHGREAAADGLAVALIPSLGQRGRVFLEVTSPEAVGIRPVAAEVAQGGSSRGTELRSGESLVISGSTSGGARSETAVLLIVTPELKAARSTETTPSLVPATRGRKTASRRALDKESEQKAVDFYISGPVGFSE